MPERAWLAELRITNERVSRYIRDSISVQTHGCDGRQQEFLIISFDTSQSVRSQGIPDQYSESHFELKLTTLFKID